jgi:hypothetical protein
MIQRPCSLPVPKKSSVLLLEEEKNCSRPRTRREMFHPQPLGPHSATTKDIYEMPGYPALPYFVSSQAVYMATPPLSNSSASVLQYPPSTVRSLPPPFTMEHDKEDSEPRHNQIYSCR